MSFDIIVTASYIPSHPSIKLIKKAIYSLHYLNYKGPKKVNVILAHDYSNNGRRHQTSIFLIGQFLQVSWINHSSDQVFVPPHQNNSYCEIPQSRGHE